LKIRKAPKSIWPLGKPFLGDSFFLPAAEFSSSFSDHEILPFLLPSPDSSDSVASHIGFCYHESAMKERISQATESEITSSLQAELPAILQGRPVMLAYFFGSAANGTALPTSDADIALVLKPKSDISAYDRMKMEFDIAAEIEARCEIKEADVRSIDSAPLTVKGMILTEGILLYSRDEEFRVDYETHYRKLYFDFLPVAKMMRDTFFRQLKEEGLSGGKARQS